MDHKSIEQRLHLGLAALKSGDLAFAEEFFQNFLSQNGDEIHSLHFLGVVLCEKGKLEAGIAFIEKSIYI